MKKDTARSENDALKTRINHIRLQKEQDRQANEKQLRDLEKAKRREEELKRSVYGEQVRSHALAGQLDQLKAATLEDIAETTGKIARLVDDAAQQASGGAAPRTSRRLRGCAFFVHSVFLNRPSTFRRPGLGFARRLWAAGRRPRSA